MLQAENEWALHNEIFQYEQMELVPNLDLTNNGQ